MDFALPLLPLLLLATPSLLPPIHTYQALCGGRYSYFSVLYLCLGLQVPVNPSTLNDGENPACAAMTTGYVFRIENQATVMFLQKIGRTGHLTTLSVSNIHERSGKGGRHGRSLSDLLPAVPTLVLLFRIVTSLSSTGTPLLLSLATLLASRLLAHLSFAQKTKPSWHGAPEPDVKSDLLVLLSSDRWIRIRGQVDDMKAVTSGSWLTRPTNHGLATIVDSVDWVASVLIYLASVILSGAGTSEQLLVVGTVLLSHLVLLCQVSRVDELVMNGIEVKVAKNADGERNVKKYARRLDMARDLVSEVGRRDFAVRLGMVTPEQEARQGQKAFVAEKQSSSSNNNVENEIVTM